MIKTCKNKNERSSGGKLEVANFATQTDGTMNLVYCGSFGKSNV